MSERSLDISNSEVYNIEIYGQRKKVEGQEDDIFYGTIRLYWRSPDLGFGQYTIQVDENKKMFGESENMDRGEDKEFLKVLFNSLLSKIEIIG